ncbi:penicillin-binding protein 2 [Corynebacterium sp. zg254]|uniref:Penicillin-binding protein 2 n=1 Tax=Corynebacterium zhongnanshanii TaxID=2768834 RepID=A0ABQ6VDH1_9CORY|nr:MULTISPECIES: penicillin-binding protein 2 [Corynebacterium]KAB3519152.1 penicillin-binding protein 2 [Corynebacterium zhongnanshanii]MCR5914994.1 penicillin-binding protein 2 [Corynebacterium sp. zg254]
MNKAIRNVTIFGFLLVVVLLVNLTYIQAFSTDSLANNPKNSRQFLAAKTQQRGAITAGGQLLAESTADAQGYYHRSYPANPGTYGSVIGYLSDRYGAAGVELSQNSILTGEDPSLFAARTWDQLTGKKVAGANVDLTLVPAVQQVAYDQLANNGYSGSVVALKPSTGEILAMASTPSYDPSTIVQEDTEAADNAFTAYNTDANSPLLNRSTQQIQPPGSTFKVITTAAALAAGESPDTSVTAAPQITLPDTTTTLENYAGSTCAGGGTTTLRQAFAESCNTAFADLVNRHSIEDFTNMARAFGVGESLDNVGIPVVDSRIGDIQDRAALAQSSIGQRDIALTPLQNAVIAATIANGGQRMEPHLIKQITGADLSPIRKTKAKKVNDPITPQVAQQLKELMIGAEQHAGGDASIASKTGTAEHGEDSRNSNPHAWYIAFSTTADVAVAVLVENGGNAGQGATGGSVAAPIGRAVIRAAEQGQ